MADKKLPAMQWYPGDWRKDPSVQGLDLEHRGAWRELLDMMWESPERGRLLNANSRPMRDAAIARNLGIDEAKWKQIRSNLLADGVASEDDAGVLYNRRMVRDNEIRQARAEAGRKGGSRSKPVSKSKAKRGSSSSSSSSDVTSYANATEVTERESKQNGSKPRSKTRARKLPANWQPNDQHRELAAELRLNLKNEAATFRDHWKGNGETKVDWDATFRNWLRRAPSFNRSGSRDTPNEFDVDAVASGWES